MAQFTQETGTFQAQDGTELFFRKWVPDKNIGLLVFIHGIGEHSGRYETFASVLAAKKIAVFAIDLRGHGKSAGIRGHVSNFRDYLYDIKLLVNRIRDQFPDTPLFIMGHSMGGVIAARYTLNFKNDAKALILTSPAFKVSVQISTLKKSIASILSSIAPSFAMLRGMDAYKISHDEAEADAYMQDPMVHHVITGRTYTGLISHAAFCLEHSGELRIPLLVIHGADDEVCSPEGSRMFEAGASNQDKEVILLEDAAHAILHEKPRVRKKAVQTILDWIISHTAATNKKKEKPKRSSAKTSEKNVKKAPAKKTAAPLKKKPAKTPATSKKPAKRR